jgi:hypothetical protein
MARRYVSMDPITPVRGYASGPGDQVVVLQVVDMALDRRAFDFNQNRPRVNVAFE